MACILACWNDVILLYSVHSCQICVALLPLLDVSSCSYIGYFLFVLCMGKRKGKEGVGVGITKIICLLKVISLNKTCAAALAAFVCIVYRKGGREERNCQACLKVITSPPCLTNKCSCWVPPNLLIKQSYIVRGHTLYMYMWTYKVCFPPDPSNLYQSYLWLHGSHAVIIIYM